MCVWRFFWVAEGSVETSLQGLVGNRNEPVLAIRSFIEKPTDRSVFINQSIDFLVRRRTNQG